MENTCTILFISSTLENALQEWSTQQTITVKSFNFGNTIKQFIPRQLGAVGISNTTNTTQIYMVPDIMEGLLIGFLFIFFVAVGLCCTMGINSPDVLHSTTLPAGKEY